MNSRFLLLLIAMIFLSACNMQNLQPTPDATKIIEVEKRAYEAYQQEDWALAEREYRYLVQQVPSQSDPWFKLGNIYARTGQLDFAIGTYREALKRDPKNSKIWHNLGVVQLRQATNTFAEMLQYTNKSDPLHERAEHVVNSVTDLMATGFAPPDE
jgi:cytochrome c-type biogenesis protein CcmH/NrfG